MKKLLAAVLLLASVALPALAEDALPQGVIDLCEAYYPAYIIAKSDGWGDESRGQYALVLTDGEDNILCIAEKAEADSAYTFTVNNTNAVREGADLPDLMIDTGGDILYYAYEDGGFLTTYSAQKSDGAWQNVSIIQQDFTHPEYDVDTLASILDGRLVYTKQKYDKLENPIHNGNLKQLLPIPVSPEFEAAMALASFDIEAIDPSGWMIPAAPGVGGSLLEHGDTLLQVDLQSESILMLVRKADGTKRLRISDSIHTEETGPVPEDASMDVYHMWDGVLFLGNDRCSFNFTLSADREWHFTSVQSSDSFGIVYDGVENWEESSVYRNDHVVYGISPWNGDITQLNLMTLPRSYDEAIAQLNTDAYAFVNNPNPNDRLHLRVKPDKGASSLGKFYNRTPVYVIEEQGEWVHVRIGSEENGFEGYMMKTYLTKVSVACAFPQKHVLPDVYDENAFNLKAQPQKDAKEICTVTAGWNIIGVAGDDWYVIMTNDGTVGYALQSLFYDGNG